MHRVALLHVPSSDSGQGEFSGREQASLFAHPTLPRLELLHQRYAAVAPSSQLPRHVAAFAFKSSSTVTLACFGMVVRRVVMQANIRDLIPRDLLLHSRISSSAAKEMRVPRGNPRGCFASRIQVA